MDIVRILKTNRPLAQSEDYELIKYMSQKDIDLYNAEEALSEIIHRYGNYLWRICTRACKQFQQSDLLAEDIYIKTLMEGVYDKAHILKSNYLVKQNKIKPVLGKIAKNKFFDHFRKNPLDKECFIDIEKIDLEKNSDDVEIDDEPLTINQLTLEEALSKLTDREKHILYTYLNNPNRKLSDAIMEGLCLTHDTTPENIRQIKTRALKKLKKYCK